eukprot:gene10703-14371_t
MNSEERFFTNESDSCNSSCYNPETKSCISKANYYYENLLSPVVTIDSNSQIRSNWSNISNPLLNIHHSNATLFPDDDDVIADIRKYFSKQDNCKDADPKKNNQHMVSCMNDEESSGSEFDECALDADFSLLDHDIGSSSYSETDSNSIAVIEESVTALMSKPTDPVGKFLREMRFSMDEIIRYNILETLKRAPKKPRNKYGIRNKGKISEAEKNQISKERNREHARATRTRKRLFKEIIDQINVDRGNSSQYESNETKLLRHKEKDSEGNVYSSPSGSRSSFNSDEGTDANVHTSPTKGSRSSFNSDEGLK